ncbi:MAG: class I SAM-dependent methyltransferase [Chloroflexota bacterium]|nr:MAG: class I SAM-dependent methyltransferase [Chloroflexota bacterium]
MSDDQGARYDRIAEGYARHWAPVIQPAAIHLLGYLDEMLPAGSPHLLDIGTGTGTLALAALGRWPGVRVTGIDASSEMAAWADGEADRRLAPSTRSRFATTVAYADRLPFEDGTFDLAMSSFVLQLVPDLGAALAEARRVLRPGAPLGYVTWLRHRGEADPPDRVFEDLLDELGFDPPEADPPGREPASPGSAAAGLRRAGFRRVRAWADVVEHRWTARSYADFLEGFAEESLFDELVERERRMLRRRLIARLGDLPAADLRLRLPIVYVVGRVPA